MQLLYVLNGHEPVPADDTLEWGRWFEDHAADRVVAQDELPGGAFVSTVFLGIDHSFSHFGKLEHVPVLFETMIFGFDDDGDYQRRYCTWAEALAGHQEAVAIVSRKD